MKRHLSPLRFVFTTAFCNAVSAWLFLGLVAETSAEVLNQPPTGFTALFNGLDFDDWTGSTTRDPREIAALSAEKRAAWDDTMKKGIDAHWRVEQGLLVSDGQEPYLATKRDFSDFEMWVDWLIGPKGDSGIYLRGAPQVQIWEPTNKGSGGLWNNQINQRYPTEVADRPIGQWNSMFIRMVGPYVSVKLNDKPVTSNVVLENYYDPTIPIFIRGPIYLQTHGSETRFRNLFVREIPAEEANRELAQIEGDESGFESVFNGKDFSGWIGAVDNNEVVNGAIQCKAGRGGNLLTKDVYDNFVVRLEFNLPPGGNSGLAIRAGSSDDVAADEATEIQVLDDTAEQYRDLKECELNGSLYGLAPATRGYLRPVGEWNYEEVTVDGDHLTVRLNGFEVLNSNLAEVCEKPADGREHPGAARTSGHFGFCGEGDPVAFRNIRIKRLPGN
ncbi:MAG: DUF1080 domain-containing protein [Pirellulales bacterium]